ncbi:hypothetical protein JCM1840_002323 [Sporobolomyces johnsonii]
MPYTASTQAFPPPAASSRPPSYRSRAPSFYSADGQQGPAATAGLLDSQESSGAVEQVGGMPRLSGETVSPASPRSDLEGGDAHPSLPLATQQNDYAPPLRSLEVCASTFYDEAMAIHHDLDSLRTTLSQILALSSRLLILHPNSLETPTLALDLRAALLASAASLTGIDADLFELWKGEERVRVACEQGVFRFEGMTDEEEEMELEEREEEVQGLVRRFRRRVKEIKREARGEKEERRAVGEEKRAPKGVEDYLAGGVDCPNLLTKDAVHASRYLVTNPFTILARNLTDNLRALQIPQMVAASQTPSTLVPPPRPSSRTPKDPFSSCPAPLPSNPTPAGSDPNKRLPRWKADILRQKPAKKTWVERGFDEIDGDVREGAREIRLASSRGHRERWIIFFTLALFPVLLVATLLETFLGSSTSSGSSPSVSLKSVGASMMPSNGGDETESSLAGATETTTARLRLRRRESADADAELV